MCQITVEIGLLGPKRTRVGTILARGMGFAGGASFKPGAGMGFAGGASYIPSAGRRRAGIWKVFIWVGLIITYPI